jgi:hypothetical protein
MERLGWTKEITYGAKKGYTENGAKGRPLRLSRSQLGEAGGFGSRRMAFMEKSEGRIQKLGAGNSEGIR